jgi:tetratricopeptide (TPR) repeat protein
LAVGYAQGNAAKHLTRPSEEMLGKIWLEKSNFARACEQYNHLLTVFPRDFAAHYNLDWLASQEKNWEEATRHLRAALEIEPNNAQARNALGTIYLNQGNLAEVRVHCVLSARLRSTVC